MYNVYLFLWIIFISKCYINNIGVIFVFFWGWKCLLIMKINWIKEGVMLYDIYFLKLKKVKFSYLICYLMINIVRVELSGVEGSVKFGN